VNPKVTFEIAFRNDIERAALEERATPILGAD
jgi:hypothetical protein